MELEGIERVLEETAGNQTAVLETLTKVRAAEAIQDQKNFENIRDLVFLAGAGFLLWKGFT